MSTTILDSGPFNGQMGGQIAAAPWPRVTSGADRSGSLEELGKALSKAQGSIKPAVKDSANPYFKSKYADLASVYDACREALSSNGLSVIQRAVGQGRTVGITTTLLHDSGQWIEGTISVVLEEAATPQQVGSALTYLRRYSLSAMVGVAPEDDDGNAASTRTDAPANDNAKSARRAPTLPPAPSGSSPPSSSAKFTPVALRKFHALREGMGVSEDEARERVSALLARKIASINDINAEEMARVLSKMEAARGSV